MSSAIRHDKFTMSIGSEVICKDNSKNPRLILGQTYQVTGVSVMSRYVKVMVGSRSGIYLRERFAMLLPSSD